MQYSKRYFFWVTGNRLSIGHLLRRTLVRFVTLFSTNKLPGRRGAGWCKAVVFLCVALSPWFNSSRAQTIRTDISLDKGWGSVADDNNINAFTGFETVSFNDKTWKQVDVPHNWDAYEGYRRKLHGNRHGYAWYRKTFTVKPQPAGRRCFLFFEGVGSYATVWLNGKQVGYHAGGRTTFTLDVSAVIKFNTPNTIAVLAGHPAGIKDLPWVCGGCSDERGFSEGSQPMGIFRPVHLIITGDVRIEPFGVHVWNDTTVSSQSAQLYYETEVKNYTGQQRAMTLISRLIDKDGKPVSETKTDWQARSGETRIIKQTPAAVDHPQLWTLENPCCYTLVSELFANDILVDRVATPYGIRWIRWPAGKKSSNQFLLNGQPVFINGIAEYEHLLGNSHAFSAAQVRSRAMQVKAAGFNAFRDAHHPHNLRYQHYWDSLGLLWWTQMGAHVWYDTPEFRNNFKTLLKEWVKERRNSPSLVLWGLQNESKLPEDFARECTELIRSLDPTASSQRLVTTCNGGSGTDWDVPQNWTGTYGGNPDTYSEDVKRQVLIGEYGAWRTLDLHTEGTFAQNGAYSEDRMTQLLETKIRLAEAAKDSTAGHFMWLLTSHDNPGRVQGGEGYRELDRIGPVNYKGLLTPWEEPTEAWYMYRSHYAPKEKEPMVYIASHTWPGRWTKPGQKDGIVVYSNCDEVELFNDVRSQSFGRKKRGGMGTHLTWDSVTINYNVLYAVGYVNGKEVAQDDIVLHHLPPSPNFNAFYKNAKPVTQAAPGYHYLYRVNCGGPDYKDGQGNTWMADRERTFNAAWGSISWTRDFPGLPPFFASQRSTTDPVRGTKDWKLFQSFRYGREKLRYQFPVQDGDYLVELYFTEPWLGTGGGMDATGWRLFDVAVNDKVVLKNVDIWKEVGHDSVLKKTVKAKVTGGLLTVSFPNVAAGQAVISAIAVASVHKDLPAAPSPEPLFECINTSYETSLSIQDWLSTGVEISRGSSVRFSALPPELYGAQWLSIDTINKIYLKAGQTVKLSSDADIWIGSDTTGKQGLVFPPGFTDTKSAIKTDDGKVYLVFKKRGQKNEVIRFSNTAGLSAGNYFILATPASTMEPAYDLKPVASYKAANANLSGPGVKKGQVEGKDRAVFEKSSVDNAIEWNFSIGAADIYSLTISYNNPLPQTLKGRLKLLAADGTVMKEEEVAFTQTKAGKSNYITTGTGSMVNAGSYRLRLSSEEAQGVSINTLDVQ